MIPHIWYETLNRIFFYYIKSEISNLNFHYNQVYIMTQRIISIVDLSALQEEYETIMDFISNDLLFYHKHKGFDRQ